MTSAWRVREITGSDFFIADGIYREGTNTPRTMSSFVAKAARKAGLNREGRGGTADFTDYADNDATLCPIRVPA